MLKMFFKQGLWNIQIWNQGSILTRVHFNKPRFCYILVHNRVVKSIKYALDIENMFELCLLLPNVRWIEISCGTLCYTINTI